MTHSTSCLECPFPSESGSHLRATASGKPSLTALATHTLNHLPDYTSQVTGGAQVTCMWAPDVHAWTHSAGRPAASGDPAQETLPSKSPKVGA